MLNLYFYFLFICCQHGAAISNVQDGYWKHGTPTFQTQNVAHVQLNVRTPLDSNHTYAGYQEQHKPVHPQAGYQEQHKPVHPQVSGAQYPATHQLPYNYYTSLQTVPQTVQQAVPQSIQQTASQNIPFDSRVSKMQIPTNPRIATNLVLGLPKIEKDNSVSSAAAKPLYVSVAPPKANSEVTSHVGADSILKVRPWIEVLIINLPCIVCKNLLIRASDHGSLDLVSWWSIWRDGF